MISTLSADVTVGFSAPFYTVKEETGLVNLTIAIHSGQLKMEVDVNVHTFSGSATGMIMK